MESGLRCMDSWVLDVIFSYTSILFTKPLYLYAHNITCYVATFQILTIPYVPSDMFDWRTTGIKGNEVQIIR